MQPGSILIGITGQGKTRATTALLEIEATINQHIAYITPTKPVVTPEFLQLCLTAAYTELRRISDDSGSTKGALTCEDVKRFKVVLPPVEEQQQLVEAVRPELANVEAAAENVQRQIILVREYCTRLITDVVTGKVNVPAAAAALPFELDEPDDPNDNLVDSEAEEEEAGELPDGTGPVA